MRTPTVGSPLALAVVTATGGLALGLVRVDRGAAGDPVWAEVVAQLAAAASLLLLRRRPVGAAAVCLALCLVTPVLAAPVALYGVGRDAVGRSGVLCLAAAVLLVVPVWWFVLDEREDRALLAALVLALLAPWLLGRATRSAEQLADVRAVQVATEREVAQERVRQAERARLAREMHDVVAHRVSLVVLQANLLEQTTTDPAVRAAADGIRDTGRAALDEMRDVLEVLQHPDDDADGLARQSLDEVDDLVGEARGVGQPVVAVVTARRTAPPDRAERTAVRVVREGLTNAVRHAPAAPTRVLVEDVDEALHVRVENTAPQSPPTGLTTGGHGLQGLRERVQLVGGTLEAGPDDADGFVLDVHVPREAL